MASRVLFDEWRDAELAEYNKGKDVPVGKFDEFFCVYLIGCLSVLVDDKTLKEHLAYKNVGGRK